MVFGLKGSGVQWSSTLGAVVGNRMLDWLPTQTAGADKLVAAACAELVVLIAKRTAMPALDNHRRGSYELRRLGRHWMDNCRMHHAEGLPIGP